MSCNLLMESLKVEGTKHCHYYCTVVPLLMKYSVVPLLMKYSKEGNEGLDLGQRMKAEVCRTILKGIVSQPKDILI